MREIVVDTETTGLDPNGGHRIIEIGCVEMWNRVKTGSVFHSYLNPERDIPEESFRIHGISAEQVADKPLFAHITKEFLDFIGDSMLVIHNAGFDLKFLNHELNRQNIKSIPADRAVDTLYMARKKFPGAPANLDALCRKFNIDLGARTKHGALLDAQLLADVYVELTGGRQAKMILEEEVVAAEVSLAVTGSVTYRKFTASPEEITAHKEFLKKIKEPIWAELEAEA